MEHPWVVLETVASKSTPNKRYEIRRGGDGKVYCTCKAWAFAKDHVCKHLRERRAKGHFEAIANPQDVVRARRVEAASAQSEQSDAVSLSPRRRIVL